MKQEPHPIQVIGIPYAGGNADVFAELTACSKGAVNVNAIEYAGHGTRRKEPYYQTFDEMTRDAAVQIDSICVSEGIRDYILFGYSMGAVVAYELLARNLPLHTPSALMLACHEPPDADWEASQYRFLDDVSFLKKIQNMGGLAGCGTDHLNNRFFRALYFEPLRQDYELLGNYVFTHTEKKISVPAALIYSPCDIPSEKVRGWQRFFEDGRDMDLIPMGNSHFLLREVPGRVLESLKTLWTEVHS